MQRIRFAIILLLLSFNFSCTKEKKKSELVWDQNFYIIGSQSSPRATDLNGDGTLDIVMGAGNNEEEHSEQGIIAFDGKTGEILWQQESPDQVFGSPTFYDITGDGIMDVFIGGRSPHFKAIDGSNGKVIWEYEYKYENDPILKYARYNFYNSVLVPDQNNDGFSDLLVMNGGNAHAAPGVTEDRFPGVLMLFDIKTGSIISADTMPDGKESYMSPICFVQPGSKEYKIIFGTGGETLDGNLFIANLSDLKKGNLSAAKIIATEKDHGFISPPVLADINQDGLYDIIVISHGSNVTAIDGKGFKTLWKQSIPGTESSNSFAVGYFNDDKIPDFFTYVSKGVFPDYVMAYQYMFDGKNGKVLYLDSLGCMGFSSPISYDLNNDGIDEVILSINEYECNRSITDYSPYPIVNKLVYIDFKRNQVKTIDEMQGFKNIFSTPWLGDLDNDGFLDLVHCQYFNNHDILNFLGMRIKRISTPVKVRKSPVWGAYMGTTGDGIFPLKK
jgi:outer membrane protein assembly factor BamB